MRFFEISILLVIGLFQSLISQTEYKEYFTDDALRIDYFHSGTKEKEIITIDQMYRVAPWAGSRENLIDTLNAGYYMIRVFDLKSNKLIYSYGFSNLFNEWQTTEEAIKGAWKTIHETVLIPYPKNEVQVEFWRRDKEEYFTKLIFNSIIDPKSYSINNEERDSNVIILDSIKNGDYSHKVDLVIMGEGFTSDEFEKFLNVAHSLSDTLFTISPFKEYSKQFNIYFVLKPSRDSGVDDPRKGIFHNTSLNASFNTFNTQRYMMTFDTKSVHDVASMVPYDAIIILVNTETYGGGGIYNYYACTSAFNKWSAYIYIHEFGHSFAGLDDEYYTSDVAYSDFHPAGTEPWEVNVTALLDPQNIKWKKYVSEGVPIPTPWDKEKYDKKSLEYREGLNSLIKKKASEAEVEKFKKHRQKWLDDFFAKHKYHGKIGAFEGAGYSSKGLYRPSLNCIMFSKGLSDFDVVCRNAIEKRINFIIK